ncbi:hypothetical protein [Comamonas sp.]|uniref:hypothetical protein n=1 Tax=Comamonas sp. TaxID=34028 RepID=UPI0026475A6E|nr:hypothetical protein [Comamonas sp.]MDN5536597.1 hypothetical protein [Comamonas sp.]
MIEAHVYERLSKELEDLPRSIIETWQPPKAIKMLMEFDTLADKDLLVTLTNEEGKETNIKYNNIPSKELGKIYNTLGSYLHLPMPSKIKNYSIKTSSIKEIARKLERTTKGNLIIFKKKYDHFECSECGNKIIYSDEYTSKHDEIKCQNEPCKSIYKIEKTENRVQFGNHYLIECSECKQDISIPIHKLEPNFKFKCKTCETGYQCTMTIIKSKE